jgi:hypothetical protein
MTKAVSIRYMTMDRVLFPQGLNSLQFLHHSDLSSNECQRIFLALPLLLFVAVILSLFLPLLQLLRCQKWIP